MAEGAAGGAFRRVARDDTSDRGVSFRIPRRKYGFVSHLKEEVVYRREPYFVEPVCGIVGQLHSGRKFLGDRFGRMNEGVIERISDDKRLCYFGDFNTAYNGRPVQAAIKAYIIPPPYTVPNKVPLYVQASGEFCCLLFVFDVTNTESFNTARECIRNMKITLPNKYYLVGNKCDLRGTVPKEKQVKKEFAKNQARQLGAAGYFECSAKHNRDVKPIMEAIVKSECYRPHV